MEKSLSGSNQDAMVPIEIEIPLALSTMKEFEEQKIRAIPKTWRKEVCSKASQSTKFLVAFLLLSGSPFI